LSHEHSAGLRVEEALRFRAAHGDSEQTWAATDGFRSQTALSLAGRCALAGSSGRRAAPHTGFVIRLRHRSVSGPGNGACANCFAGSSTHRVAGACARDNACSVARSPAGGQRRGFRLVAATVRRLVIKCPLDHASSVARELLREQHFRARFNAPGSRVASA
jgi:hypothetical protein